MRKALAATMMTMATLLMLACSMAPGSGDPAAGPAARSGLQGPGAGSDGGGGGGGGY